MASKKPVVEESVSVLEIKRETIELCIVGTTPMIQQAMSAKVRAGLLLPPQKKNAAEKAGSLKHEPLQEYRGAFYRTRGTDAPTAIGMPAGAFKAMIGAAALRMPGVKRTEVEQLTYIEGDTTIPVYGVPQMLMSVVRSADMNRTPDIRTRPILPKWALRVRVGFVIPIMNRTAVVNLISAAGVFIGLSDWRPEKGSGNFGQFRICDPTDPEFKEILKMGRKAQEPAMDSPEPYDDETSELMSWYEVETKRRGFKVAA